MSDQNIEPDHPEPIDLIRAADEQIAKVRTQSLDLSFNELLDMYTNDELVISPEYQRLFRWSEAKESRFIESMILELPLPPLFVIELEEGQYELIDGLQRISSYLHFRGKLKAEHRSISEGDFLTLTDCDIVEQLNGATYDGLPRAIEIKLKRAFVRVEVVRRESDNRLRYHMFKRLNTGGELLSEQEIRNCTIRLLNNTFNVFLVECSQQDAFKECISKVANEQIDRKFDQELVLRFLSFKNWRSEYVHEVGTFLTEYMEKVSDPGDDSLTFDYDVERQTFQKTFALLNNSLGDEAFSHIDRRGRKQPFSVYHFESFTLGIQPHLSALDPENTTQMEKLKEICWDIKNDQAFRDITTGGGKNSRGPLRERIDYVSKFLGDNL
ncbi:MAG TPA: DUF262 domain-containing protein [Planctomycetaceae bacterium]|nr:DUF262 domain-containing protein [Planctomycetaceae bacterium]|tara:strand:- start:6664 stop:7812 length:1149 start_codon:yes stop_codon:yes gene_type:complete